MELTAPDTSYVSVIDIELKDADTDACTPLAAKFIIATALPASVVSDIQLVADADEPSRRIIDDEGACNHPDPTTVTLVDPVDAVFDLTTDDVL